MVDNAEGQAKQTFIAVLGLVLVAILVGVLMTVSAPPPAAQGGALTVVTNVSVGKTSSFISVRKDNGVVIDLNPQQKQWGVRSVVVRNGTCVSINSAPQVCATSGAREVGLVAGGSYSVRRTK